MVARTVRTSRWLAHHGPDHLERCTVVAGRHVCRRCAVLYPVAALAALVAATLAGGAPTWTVAALWILPVPMVVDWTAEHLGLARWSPRRQVVVSAIGAPALGLALLAHAGHPFTGPVVAPVTTWTLVCLTTAFVGMRRAGPEDWASRHEAAEARRTERLERVAAGR